MIFFDRVTKIYPDRSLALDQVTFSVDRGEFLTIVGHSGEKNQTIVINPADLKIEFSRASGPGGQNVNKRETAVRIVHLPTGLTAHSDAERAQERNKDRALEILKGKLYKRQADERQKKAEGMSISKTTEIEWGSQIRSYVLHPYKLVKDHRTGVETSQIDKILAGQLDEFIEAEKNL